MFSARGRLGDVAAVLEQALERLDQLRRRGGASASARICGGGRRPGRGPTGRRPGPSCRARRRRRPGRGGSARGRTRAASSAWRRAARASSRCVKGATTPPAAPDVQRAGSRAGSRARMSAGRLSRSRRRRPRRGCAEASPRPSSSPAQTTTAKWPSTGQRSVAASSAAAPGRRRAAARGARGALAGARRPRGAPTGSRRPPRRRARGRRVRRRAAGGRRRSPTGSRAARRRGGSAGTAPDHPERRRCAARRPGRAPAAGRARRATRDHVRRRLARQDRRAPDRIGLVGLGAVREQPPAPVLDRDRPPDLGFQVVDDLLQVGHRAEPYDAAMDVVVVGAGISGLAAAYELQRRGARVTVLEAEGVGAGQSVGLARIFRIAHRGARLCALALEAREGWRRWERELGMRPAGRRGARGGRRRGQAAAMRAAGAPVEPLRRDEIRARCRSSATPGAAASSTRWPGRPAPSARSTRWPPASTVRRAASPTLERIEADAILVLRRHRHALARAAGSTSS